MKPNISANPNKGFALVITLLLMIFLGLLCVGMLSLSSISLRSSVQNSDVSKARANARLALMIAIGELQRYTGADTRVTAPADLADPSAPPVFGAWKSWEGKNHDPDTGRPIAPDYGLKSITSKSPDARFLSWLVSGPTKPDANGNRLPPSALVSTSPAGDGSTIPLLAGGSLRASDTRQVHVVPTPSGNDGRHAWWVSPENQKARLSQPYLPRTNDAAGWVEMGQSHGIPNPAVFGLDALNGDPEDYIADANSTKAASRAFTLPSTELIADGSPLEPQHSFHDLSVSARGLLTNTATGGWRKDLSILTEKWSDIYASYPGGKLPLFRFSPEDGDTTEVPKPVKPAPSVLVTSTAALNAATPPQSNLYPWSDYSTIIGTIAPNTYQAGSASWESLVSFATSYKNFTYNAGGLKSPFVWDLLANQKSNLGVDKIYNYRHVQRLHPQIARFQFIVYAKAVETPLDQNPKRYQLRLMYVPLFTLWNPYNVSLEHTVIGGSQGSGDGSGKHVNFLGFGWRRSPPGAMAIVNPATYIAQGLGPEAVPPNQYKLFTPGNFQVLDAFPGPYGNNANPYDTFLDSNVAKYGANNKWVDKRTYGCWLPEGTLTFKPGEAKIFSPAWSDPAYGFSGVLRLREGYDPTDIVGSEFGSSGNLLATQNYWFLFRPDRVTQPFLKRIPGNGFSLTFGNGANHFGKDGTMPTAPGDEYHNLTALASESEANAYWPADEVDEVTYSVGELAAGSWIPIFSISFGPRMTIGTAPGTVQNRPTKGVLQNNALASMVLSDPGSGDVKDHPVNNTFDFAYHSLPLGSNITPNLSPSEGYIATGYQSGDGLTRLIMADLPLRPMASLVELQGWNPRGQNPYPPFQMNLIGNSDATPLIPQDDIVPPALEPSQDSSGTEYSASNKKRFNLMHDDAYCANHLLFDDWFVSSIAPQPEVLGGDIAKDIETFYGDFLSGEEKLSNRSYQAITADSGLAASEVTERIGEIINSPDGWLKIASRLEVDGMFNVNSTSVDAWKALLGHAKSREEIAMHGANGIEPTDPSQDHPITRGAVAPDVEAGTDPAVGNPFAGASEYTGFRSLTDDQIGDLAKKIVEQVRLRGPFLSLSEFVNRQLSSNGDLALAGAVQAAINNLEDDPMEDLRNPANSLSDTTMLESDDKLDGVDYEFSEAAVGDSAYGAPGWIRQADVLRPIAPILSARDDTFTIRAYGDALDAAGKVVAQAWCEAVVTRTRNFCDETDAADSTEPPVSPTNILFGRKYEIVTFRWLNADEV